MNLTRADVMNANTAVTASGAEDAPRSSAAQALYLMTPSACVVDLDGPALSVRRKQRGVARFPLQRVSRVVSAATVEWRPRALGGCLERGIPIVLLDASGKPVGYVQPVNARRSSLDQLLCEWAERSDWHRYCENWLRAERMRAMRSWLSDRQARSVEVNERQQKEAVRRFVYAHDWRDALLGQAGIYRAALMALACQAIRTAGLAPSYAGHAGTELNLAAELCDLLCLALELQLDGLGREAPEQHRACLRIVETYTAGLEQRCTSILGRLHRRVSELLHEWR
jgi:hypothetical protein